jgi:hypothetical protein
LWYALHLAADAAKRKRSALDGFTGAYPIALEDLEPWGEYLSDSTIRRRLEQLKFEVGVGPSAIYKRRQREVTAAQRPARSCATPDCDNTIPPEAHGKRKYCEECSSGSRSAARVRAFRLRHSK